MNEQILTTTPLVNIAMAIYNPRLDWLKQQLQSLNNQTYKCIKITIIDDCSNKVSFKEIQKCVYENINNYSYSIEQNTENLGSNKTFEKLTEQAEGEYISYCDQDDIWLPEKIEKLVEFIKDSKSQLVCSDVYIIDAEGNIKANSITEIRKRHIFKQGEGLVDCLLFRNFVIGCTMMMPSKVAKAALPFINFMVHDHYLALFASIQGNIGVYKENLIKYRIHDNNQTNVLSNVSNKNEYYEVQIKAYLRRMEEIVIRFDIPKAKEAYEWGKARERYFFNNNVSVRTLWKYRKLNLTTSIFEIIMFKMPKCIFQGVLKLIQSGKL